MGGFFAHLVRPFCFAVIAALVFAGHASAAVSSGSTSFNGKSVYYSFTGDKVKALSYAEGSTCRVTATVDGETHRIVISAEKLSWNGVSVPLDGFKNVAIEVNGTEARFVVDDREVVVK